MSKVNEIIGYKRFRNDEGVERLVVHVLQNPDSSDLKNGYVGFIVSDVWIPVELFGNFSSDVIGKVLKPRFELVGKYARVVDVEFE